MAAAASDGSLALPAGITQTFMPATQIGPGLYEGMSEASMIAALNSWGTARDYELLDLKANLGATQVGVSTAFNQAQEALLTIVNNFRAEAETMRQHGFHEAAQSVARLEQVVAEARTRFDAQDGRFSDGLNALVLRQQAVESWAQAAPTRVAAIVQAAPAPTWVPASPVSYTTPTLPTKRIT